MDVQIREATAADAAAIALLNREVQKLHADAHPWRFKQPSDDVSQYERDVAKQLATSGHFALLAMDGETPVGYALCEIARRPETPLHFAFEMIYVHQLSVSAKSRRKGAGRALLDACKAKGEPLGISLLVLDTWSFNETALAFFRKYGLAPYNVRLWNRAE